MTRLWDRWLQRDAGFWEGMASGAAVLTTTYGSPDAEAVLPTLARATHEAYGSNSPVFAAILVRLKLFSEARFTWQALDDKHLFGDTSLSVLEYPFGPGTNSGELLVRMQQDASLAGQAYIWAPPGEGRLVRKRPDWVTIISELVPTADGGWYRRKTGYWWEPPKDARGQGEGHFMDAADVCHWAPIPDPLADFRGMSWLSPVLRDVQGDNGMSAYKIKYLQHAATPNLLLKYAQKLAPGTVDSIRERVTARYGGVDNAFRTLVLDQGADATVIGANMQQLDFSGVSATGVERILADSMVPPVLVGLEPLRGAGRGYQESLLKLANLWARPEWRSACGALEQIAPPPAPGVRLWYDASDIAALQDGEMEKGQTALVRSQAILTSRQAGATFDSAVAFVDSGEVTKLQFDKAAAALPAGNVQHLLPQAQPGATADPLPPGTQPRLPLGSTSPGDGGNNTRPVPQLAAGRRSVTAGANGHGQ